MFGGETVMKVNKLRSVDAAIRTLDESERRKVFAWLQHLENWENDEQIQKMAKLTIYKDVYVLNTSDDIRIFFKLDLPKQEISIIDIAKPSRFKNVPVAWSDLCGEAIQADHFGPEKMPNADR
jgi:mRNA-degrading endonuclease RelE of RelBE toxin-antitoxin system